MATPFLGYLVLSENHIAALLLFIVAGFTDMVRNCSLAYAVDTCILYVTYKTRGKLSMPEVSTVRKNFGICPFFEEESGDEEAAVFKIILCIDIEVKNSLKAQAINQLDSYCLVKSATTTENYIYIYIYIYPYTLYFTAIVNHLYIQYQTRTKQRGNILKKKKI